jgi:hypothetical protein
VIELRDVVLGPGHSSAGTGRYALDLGFSGFAEMHGVETARAMLSGRAEVSLFADSSGVNAPGPWEAEYVAVSLRETAAEWRAIRHAAAAESGAVRAAALRRARNDPRLVINAISSPSSGELRLLIAAGADLEVVNGSGLTAIIIAADRMAHGRVGLLADAGANVEAVSSDLQTALHWAARLGSVKCVRTLLSCGAELNAVNAKGLTPIACAVCSDEAGTTDVVRYLAQAGAEVSVALEESTGGLVACSMSCAGRDHGWIPSRSAGSCSGRDSIRFASTGRG